MEGSPAHDPGADGAPVARGDAPLRFGTGTTTN